MRLHNTPAGFSVLYASTHNMCIVDRGLLVLAHPGRTASDPYDFFESLEPGVWTWFGRIRRFSSEWQHSANEYSW